jgi:hypothetical protein
MKNVTTEDTETNGGHGSTLRPRVEPFYFRVLRGGVFFFGAF